MRNIECVFLPGAPTERGRPRPQRVRRFYGSGFHRALRIARVENQDSWQCLAAADEDVRALFTPSRQGNACWMEALLQSWCMQPIEIIEADLSRPEHQQAVLELVDAYSRDPMGDGKPLSPEARARLIPGLQRHPTTVIFLAYENTKPVGIAVCFTGFSTFAAQPLINIHDLNVLPTHRGQGIGQRLIAGVEAKARATGCCKLSLEVQENNDRARRSYAAAGFTQALYQSDAGGALFMTKRLA